VGWGFPVGVTDAGQIDRAHGEDAIREAIWLILSTAKGERVMRPEFGCGIHDYVFDVVDAATLGRMELEVRTALERWEPRIEVIDVRLEPGDGGDGLLEITIDYRVRETNNVRNLVAPFYVIPAEEGA
jgi:hypothetical protein